MAPLRRCLLLLGVAALLLDRGSGSSSSHSLRYFHTAMSEAIPGQPQFSIVGYLDGQLFVQCDSDTREMLPRVPWMEEAGKEDPQYWERETRNCRDTEAACRANLVIAGHRFNQNNSTGLHIGQRMYGCEVGPDGRFRGGNMQFAYDREDFLALDLETTTWTARVPQAEPTKRRWEAETQEAAYWKSYLEKECVEWLRRYLGYQKQPLLRTEPPTWKVARKKGYDGWETLTCQLYGFYPKDIEVTWVKDGEDRKPDTLMGGVVPNSDGTYHTWLSIEVDPKERGRYRCRVGHDSLPEPLDLAWEEPASMMGLILGLCVGVSAAILLVVIFYIRHNCQRSDNSKAGYKIPGPDRSLTRNGSLRSESSNAGNGSLRSESSNADYVDLESDSSPTSNRRPRLESSNAVLV